MSEAKKPDELFHATVAKGKGLTELDLRWLLADAEAGKRVLIVTAVPELKIVLLKQLAEEFHCKFEFTKVPTGIEVRKV